MSEEIRGPLEDMPWMDGWIDWPHSFVLSGLFQLSPVEAMYRAELQDLLNE